MTNLEKRIQDLEKQIADLKKQTPNKYVGFPDIEIEGALLDDILSSAQNAEVVRFEFYKILNVPKVCISGYNVNIAGIDLTDDPKDISKALQRAIVKQKED